MMYTYRGKITLQGSHRAATSEELTIIFSTSVQPGEPVYTCWQWTEVEIDDQNTETKVTVQQFGLIDSANPTSDGSIKIGFCHDGDYIFEATTAPGVQPPFSSLTVLVTEQNSGKISNSSPALLKFSTFTNALESLKWCVYVGKLSFNTSSSDQDRADNETILITLPETFAVNCTVCAYWQWTRTLDGTTNKNVSFIGSIISSDFTSQKYQIKFQAGDYVFEGTCSTDGNSLELKMTSGEVTSDPIYLDSSAPSSGGRSKRSLGFLRRTATITNDTDETVVISLVDSANSSMTKGRILAAGGAALTFLGLATGLPGIAIGFANAINIASIGFASTTVMDTWLNADHAVEDVVTFPGHSVWRDSSGIWGNSNAEIIQLKIKEDNALALLRWRQADLGNEDWLLSKIQENPPTTLLSLNLDAVKRSEYRAWLKLEGFIPDTSAESVTTSLLDLPVETMLASDLDGTGMMEYGTWSTNNINFSWDNMKYFYYIQPADQTGVARGISLLPRTTLYVLRLRGYIIADDVQAFEVDSINYSSEQQVLARLGELARRVAMMPRICSWKTGEKLWRYAPRKGLILKSDANYNSSFVFLMVDSIQCFQKVV